MKINLRYLKFALLFVFVLGMVIPSFVTATTWKQTIMSEEARFQLLSPSGEIGLNDFRISDMGPDGDPDYDGIRAGVAYNSVNNEYLVVWRGDDASGILGDGEYEIFGQRINAVTGEEVGVNDFRISDMGPDGDINYQANTPSVAYNPTNNEYLVVWDGDNLVDDEFEIWGQRLDAETGMEVGENDFRISHMGWPDGDIDYWAGESAIAYNGMMNEFLVIWSGCDDLNHCFQYSGDADIYGQRIDGQTGQEVGENDFQISSMGNDADSIHFPDFPDIAYNSINNEYLVVWQSTDYSIDPYEYEIYGQRLDANGSQMGVNDFRISEMGLDGDSLLHNAEEPALVYNPAQNEYLVVWRGSDYIGSSENSENEIFGQRIEATTGSEIGINDFRISDMGPDGDYAYNAHSVDVNFDLTHDDYLVVWSGDDNTGTLVDDEYEIFGQRIDAATSSEIGENDFRLSDLGQDGDPIYRGFSPVIAFNHLNLEFLIAWYGEDLPQVDGEFEIFGQRYEIGNEPPPPTPTATCTPPPPVTITPVATPPFADQSLYLPIVTKDDGCN